MFISLVVALWIRSFYPKQTAVPLPDLPNSDRPLILFFRPSPTLYVRSVDARRYPYVRAKGGVPTPTTAVRYGKDGRRRLFCGVDAAGNTGGDQAEVGGGIDPRERALASFDVLLAVFSFIDRYFSIAAGATTPPTVVVVDFSRGSRFQLIGIDWVRYCDSWGNYQYSATDSIFSSAPPAYST